jgi:hypothetical protein
VRPSHSGKLVCENNQAEVGAMLEWAVVVADGELAIIQFGMNVELFTAVGWSCLVASAKSYKHEQTIACG